MYHYLLYFLCANALHGLFALRCSFKRERHTEKRDENKYYQLLVADAASQSKQHHRATLSSFISHLLLQ